MAAALQHSRARDGRIDVAGGGGRADRRGAVRALVRRGGPARRRRRRPAGRRPQRLLPRVDPGPLRRQPDRGGRGGHGPRLAAGVPGRRRGRAERRPRHRPAAGRRASTPGRRDDPDGSDGTGTGTGGQPSGTPAVAGEAAASARRLRDRPVQPPGARRRDGDGPVGRRGVQPAGHPRRRSAWARPTCSKGSATPCGPASRPARRPRDGRGVHQRLPRRDAIGEPGRLPLQVPRGRRADRRRRPLPGRQAGDAGRVPAHLQRPDRRRRGDRPGGRPASQADRQADRRAGDPVPRRDGREARGPRPRRPAGRSSRPRPPPRRRRARGRDRLRRRAPPRQRPRARRGAAQPGRPRRS